MHSCDKKYPGSEMHGAPASEIIAISKSALSCSIIKGVIDGDLRRCISNKVDINQTLIKEVMTPDFKSIQSKDLAIDAAKVMEDRVREF